MKPMTMSRRAFVAGGAALLMPHAGGAAVEEPSLRELAARKGILYGSTVAVTQIQAADDFTELVRRECALIVPENAMKWFEMSERPNELDYAPPDVIADFARANDLALRGHTMLWYWRTPNWFFELPDRAAAEAAILRRVRDMGAHYRGRIHSWDVINEPLNPADGREDGLRKAVFLEAIGPDYVDLAYHAAREADPKARLVLNEYDVEYDTPEQDQKRAAVLRLLERMKKKGTPVDVVGVQAHLDIGRFPFSAEKLARYLAELAAMDVQIQITELDVTDENAPTDIAERDRLVAEEYRKFLDVALDQPAVKMVVTWGLSDRHSWIVRHETNDMKWRRDALPSRPLPFDAALARKPAWTALASAFERAPKRSPG
jgi:endo-1,4-beta-xylanase